MVCNVATIHTAAEAAWPPYEIFTLLNRYSQRVQLANMVLCCKVQLQINFLQNMDLRLHQEKVHPPNLSLASKL